MDKNKVVKPTGLKKVIMCSKDINYLRSSAKRLRSMLSILGYDFEMDVFCVA